MTALIDTYKDFLGDGSKDSSGKTLEEFLLEYDPYKYKTPSVTADIVVLKESKTERSNLGLQILMVKRKNHPCIHEWALPGGFAEEGENLAESAKRELEEETGVSGVEVSQLYTWSDPYRDPRGRVITTSYLAYLNKEVHVVAGDDAKEAKWFDVTFNLVGTEYNGTKKVMHYQLELTNRSAGDAISAKVEVLQTLDSFLSQRTYHMNTTSGIAFDHGKIIVDALLHCL